jgi:hypothetical protein
MKSTKGDYLLGEGNSLITVAYKGRGGVFGGVVVRAEEILGEIIDNTGRWGWGKVGGSQDLYPLRHLGDGGRVRGPTQRGISQGGDPAGLELRASWVEVALARRQTMGRPTVPRQHDIDRGQGH